MNASVPAAPDDGPVPPRPWRELFGEYAPVVGRRFHDRGRLWTVVAVTAEHLRDLGLPARDLSPELADGWLSFDCGLDRRRLAPIPSGWESLDDEELAELCRRAVSTPRAHR